MSSLSRPLRCIVSTYIDSSCLQRIDDEAARRNVTRAELIRDALLVAFPSQKEEDCSQLGKLIASSSVDDESSETFNPGAWKIQILDWWRSLHPFERPKYIAKEDIARVVGESSLSRRFQVRVGYILRDLGLQKVRVNLVIEQKRCRKWVHMPTDTFYRFVGV